MLQRQIAQTKTEVCVKGQWRGQYISASTGDIVIEVDELKDTFEGYAYLFNDDERLPGTVTRIEAPKHSNTANFLAHLQPLHPATFEPLDIVALREALPDVEFPTVADVTAEWTDESLMVQWIAKDENGKVISEGRADLERPSMSRPSELITLPIRTWEEFKSFATKVQYRRFIFRGQSDRWRLRTTFHRTGRADIRRYVTEDITALYRQLTPRMTHLYDVANPAQNAAFYNLIQHHGYPTPLLDWTFSPFVAAYFA